MRGLVHGEFLAFAGIVSLCEMADTGASVERCETQPGEAGAWPGRVVVRELLKWRCYGLMKFSGPVDGHVLRAWTPCV